MKGLVLGASVWVAGVLTLAAQTIPVYDNSGPMVSPPMVAPQVDASVFVNRSLFSVSNILLFDFANCLDFTNNSSGVMIGNPGFWFDHKTNENRQAANSFRNDGSISVATNLLVYATNIISPGPLSAGPGGLVRLDGSNLVNLSRAEIRSGASPQFDVTGGYTAGTNYVNDTGIGDLYWGAGFNNTFQTTNAGTNAITGPPMLLVSSTNYFVPNFGLPYASSPLHEVEVYGLTNLVQVTVPDLLRSGGVPPGYDAAVYVNALSSNQTFIQMVFVPTNPPDLAIRTQVRFATNRFTGRAAALVEFSSVARDYVLELDYTNYLYVLDQTATTNNIALYQNLNASTRRPSTLWVTRVTPAEWNGAAATNAVFDPGMVTSPFFVTNQVDVMYAAYAAQLGEAVTNGGAGTWPPVNPVLLEPTNMPGRIEIVGGTVQFEETRMRAESSVNIRTPNLRGNLTNTLIDAPYLLFDITTPEPTLTISNLLPSASVQRMSGPVYAWSGLWTNYVVTLTVIPPVPPATNLVIVTNLFEFNTAALIVEHGLLSSRPVVLDEFGVHATNLVIADNLNVGSTVHIEADMIHVTGGLTLPPHANWAVTNVHPYLTSVTCTNQAPGLCSNVVTVRYPMTAPSLTNDGSIFVPGVAYLGSDLFTYLPEPAFPVCCSCGCKRVPLGYRNIVNRGTLSAAAQYIRADYFENRSGLAVGSGSINAFEGLLSLEAGAGVFADCQVNGNGDVQIFARDLLFQGNVTITTGFTNIPGALIVAATNRLTDEVDAPINYWTVTAGFRFLHKPRTGDLMNTHIESRIARLAGLSTHVWAGEDRGPNNSGFTDNLALGWLRLDGTNRSLFAFSGAGPNSALYVDYLELVNYATNYDRALWVDTNASTGLTIYFANANIPPEKLESHPSGRLRWVSTFAGPNSSTDVMFTNVVFPSGPTNIWVERFNHALRISKDIDSDLDGIVNYEDPTPFYLGNLGIEFQGGTTPRARITWDVYVHATNYIDFTTSLDPPVWTPLMMWPPDPVPWRVTVDDPDPVTETRFYRVRIIPP